uniref:Uncharacterized protein n=2 Tax=Oryza sativa subsp. japonica TaxID=39947 RepID=Q10HF8_ORYSJ|nr:hypothetical protein [Oryza sativa Japonica Group]ABF97385.1 hypothetical protein LOC_Os03g39310 [Oryza sativa Japonica Group]
MQLLPAALVASSLAPIVVVLSSFLLVVTFVPPSSRSCPSSVFRQVSRCSPVVVFVLGSASSSPVPAASRLRSRIAAEVVPSPSSPSFPFVSAARSPSSFPHLVAWWLTCGVRMSTAQPSYLFQACSFACVLRVASVVPEVPETWFAVVAKGSEGRSL